MKLKRLITITCLLLSSGCTVMDKNDQLSLKKPTPSEHPYLLDFLATGKTGESQFVFDGQNNEEGTATISRRYLAASGKQCRAYHWSPTNVEEKPAARNLKVVCQTSARTWTKIRTLSNIEALLEKEPVGYVLH